MAEEEERSVTSRTFSAYGLPLEMVTSFRYLGRLISEADIDWLEMVLNMEKARTVWRRMTGILRRKGAGLQVYVFFFKAVVQSVLLLGAEKWVVTPNMGRVLGGLQDQVARRLTGRLPRWWIDGKWD